EKSREEKGREKKRGGGEKKDLERLSSSPEFVRASAPRDRVELATTVNRRPSSCSSRRDEAIDTNRVAIGARTSPHAPPEDRPARARETHAPPPPQLRRRRRSTFR
ncbi:unnamed protein product, partial [Brassica oleracea]